MTASLTKSHTVSKRGRVTATRPGGPFSRFLLLPRASKIVNGGPDAALSRLCLARRGRRLVRGVAGMARNGTTRAEKSPVTLITPTTDPTWDSLYFRQVTSEKGKVA